MEMDMDWDGIEGQSKQVKSKIKEQWGKLSGDELGRTNCRDRLEGNFRERYGLAKGAPARPATNSPGMAGEGGACAVASRRGGEESSTTAMIGLVIVTHGGLAREFRAALEHVVSPQTQLETISIAPEDDVEARRQEILAAVHRVDTGAGVVLLTDMFGGTPCNLAISLLDEANVEVIAGVNLPMLVKLTSVRGEVPLARAVDFAKEAGRKYISVASEVLSGERSQRPEADHSMAGRTTPEQGSACHTVPLPALSRPDAGRAREAQRTAPVHSR
jgi:PTS system mannose-specific IIA component